MAQQTSVEYFDAVNKLANENQSNRTKQQTAVEWLEEQINLTFYVAEASEMSKRFQSIYEQAKTMEKEQIIDAHIDGQSLVSCKDEYAELYYNETYKK